MSTRPKFKRLNNSILMVILIVTALILFVFVAAIFHLLATWINALDTILDPSFFSTLAGLALAAAAILLTSRELVENNINTKRKIRNGARDRAEDLNCPDISAAEEWYKARVFPSKLEINNKRFSHPVTEMLHRWRDMTQYQKYGDSIREGYKNFISSFILLIIGLVESLTINLLVDASSIFSNDILTLQNLPTLFSKPLLPIIGIIDLLISSIVLILGIYYLVCGTKNIKMMLTM